MHANERFRIANSRSPEDCRWRAAVSPSIAGSARCRFLQQLLGTARDSESDVSHDACVACCQSYPPTFESLNPVVASLLFDRAGRLIPQETNADLATRLRSLQHWAEQHLEIDVPPLPPRPIVAENRATTSSCRPLVELLPPPSARCGAPVRHWAVGVTTAPRRRSHLGECLDSLSRAGWPRPHLFIDGAAATPSEWSFLPMTVRDEQLGAWPNFYLSLLELLMREPLADAFMMVQDDALFYCRENVRQYLEGMLWPGDEPGIVTLYCASSNTRDEPGWFKFPGYWNSSSIALIFPRDVVRRMLMAPSVFDHRWLDGEGGKFGIPDVVADWAEETATPVFVPSPTLAQHIGETSSIWLGAYELSPNRRTTHFLGDVVATPAATWRDLPAARFPEGDFTCDQALESDYQARVIKGRQLMAQESAVICGLCRDVASYLPTTMARAEKLAGMFRTSNVVVFENDSVDETPQLLQRWTNESAGVTVISERLGQPRFHGTSLQRTERMAYFRNRCRDHVLAHYGDRRFVLVVDMDLLGGWSYDGVANSFGHEEWDFIGSNGIRIHSSEDNASREYADVFAHRAVGQTRMPDATSRELRFRRGEPLVPVWSCFNGLGVYRMDCYQAAPYAGHDCEHVVFHQSLRERGFSRLFLNPSQIVLYGPWSHCL